MNTDIYQQLLTETEDLLYRVRIYDRDMVHTDEIIEMDQTHEMISSLRWMGESEMFRTKAIEKLIRMRHRLMTMMEDLLFTA
ncbi:hypothetical protein OMP38_22485 [Cohnella ginsengisoli]|uniref:Uncharacterized protein n=1 Tax=Cohnella ginsengisoli TaxID=425004 RepID=A0A9X4KK91_9BACL|nr:MULTISPECIES: hypothetical protein [Cohnella]MDG0793306.1 hypothetical protein [Cohnella ginsengisoli]